MMKNKIWVLMCLSIVHLQIRATDYYVRTDGNNNNTGIANNVEEAWKTVDHAISQLEAGDHLYINDGTYITKALKLINIQGAPDKITRISAVNRWKAVLTQDATTEDDIAVLSIEHSAYVIIDGFEIYDKIDAGVGISVRDGSHHITVKNCYVHDCGCNGISSRTSDYIIFEKNIVRGNAKRNPWNCSGISIWHAVEHDQKPGFHIIVRKNIAYENECDLPFTPMGYEQPTDGNGIIIDDFRNTQGGGQEGGYKAAILVENNLSFNNGGRGINIYKSDNVVVRNNTTYHNLRVISKYADFPGDITIANSKGSSVYNNLIIKNPEISTKALRCYDNDAQNTKIFNNMIIGPKDFCGQDLYEQKNTYIAVTDQEYPQLKKPRKEVIFSSMKDFRNYFAPMISSPAIDAGAAKKTPEEDIDTKPRPVGRQTDIGCYEWYDKD